MTHGLRHTCLTIAATLAALLAAPAARATTAQPDSTVVHLPVQVPVDVVGEEFEADDHGIDILATDTIPVQAPFDKYSDYELWEERQVDYNPDPTRAVWMSALFPGLGQVYNRRYWKLPLVVGGYLGLAYATSWNNTMLGDYTKAYRDIMDTDPLTNSYMDFFPPTVHEDDLDKTWLTNVLQSRKNYFRRNRDLCIISMVGLYLLAMVDAYVDASLAHFDITPDLGLEIAPALIPDGRNRLPSVGVQWALNF